MNNITSRPESVSEIFALQKQKEITPKPLIEPKPSLWKRIKQAYIAAIKKLVQFLRRHKLYTLALIVGTLLGEPLNFLRAVVTMPLAWKKHFNYYDLNPLTITAQQAAQEPIIFLHGNLHNPTACLSLAKSLKKANIGPVYTVTLPSGHITEKDHVIVENKMQEIRAQYALHRVEEVKFKLVGHSRGGDLARLIAWSQHGEGDGAMIYSNKAISKVISLGSVAEPRELNDINNLDEGYQRYREIIGSNDCLLIEPSLIAPYRYEVDVGHAGLLYSKRVHKKIIEILARSQINYRNNTFR